MNKKTKRALARTTLQVSWPAAIQNRVGRLPLLATGYLDMMCMFEYMAVVEPVSIAVRKEKEK